MTEATAFLSPNHATQRNTQTSFSGYEVGADASEEVGITRAPCPRIEALAFLCPRDCCVD